MEYSFSRNGFSLVEVLVATSVILIFLASLIGAYNTYLHISLSNIREVKATFLTEETIEAVKILRDDSWSNFVLPLTAEVPYRLTWNGSSWRATTTNTFIDSTFDRTFTLSSVSRDSQSEIVTSGGTVDPNTKKISVSVSWFESGATTTKILESYVTNLFSN